MIILKMRDHMMLTNKVANAQVRAEILNIWKAIRWPNNYELLVEAIEDSVRPWEQSTWWEHYMGR